MRIRITGPGIYDGQGVEVPTGAEFDVTSKPQGWDGRFVVVSGDETDEEKVAILNPAEPPAAAQPVLPLAAKDQGGGWWAVTDANGAVFGKKLRKDDAEAFNTLTDEEKVELVKVEA